MLALHLQVIDSLYLNPGTGVRNVAVANRQMRHSTGKFVAPFLQICSLARITDTMENCIKPKEAKGLSQILPASHLSQLAYRDIYSHY